jgi:hypothetical protein
MSLELIQLAEVGFYAFQSCPVSPSCPVPAVLSWPCPGCSVRAVLSGLSCPGYPIPAVLSRLSCPSCPVLAVLSRLSYPGCPVPAVLSWLYVPAVQS